MRTFCKILLPLLSLLVIASLIPLVSACRSNSSRTMKIGVLLPLTGPDSVESKELLDWAQNNLNSQGGIGDIPVELVYKDTYSRNILALAQELVDDPAIQIVIGPQKSSEMRTIAPLFIDSKKLLISPMATAGDILRAYEKKDFIWRTCQSDVAQIRSILYELSTRKVTKISLMYIEDDYGKTFLEWTGFFCTELGIDLLNTVGYDASANMDDVLEQALSGRPDYIVAAAFAVDAVELKKLLDVKSVETKLFFTDAAETPYLIEQLGSASNGIELISPAADPWSGFEDEYFKEYGYYPWDYAASTYDAFLLSVYTLARQKYQGGLASLLNREGTEESFKKVISGTGVKIKWSKCSLGISLLLKGEMPDIDGATGPLEYDKEFGVDPTESFYSLNRIETRDGVTDFWTVRRFNSCESSGVGLLDGETSAVYTRASGKYLELNETAAVFQPGKRENLRAVIVSISDGWNNYRHQSDALAIYNLLKSNGVTDNDIVLFSIDDVPWLKDNSMQGNIHHEVNGANLRANAVIGYAGESVNAENLQNVLLGKHTEKTPVILESDEKSNVLLYLVGHGMPRVIDFNYGDDLTSKNLAQIVNEMYSLKKYRQLLIFAETCYGESLGMELKTPGAVFLTGASRIESSFGATYDLDIRQWLADDFTTQLLKVMLQPNITLEELYLTVYKQVSGSHVRIVNYANFGKLDIPMSEFIKP